MGEDATCQSWELFPTALLSPETHTGGRAEGAASPVWVCWEGEVWGQGKENRQKWEGKWFREELVSLWPQPGLGVCETGVKCRSIWLFLVVLLVFDCSYMGFSWGLTPVFMALLSQYWLKDLTGISLSFHPIRDKSYCRLFGQLLYLREVHVLWQLEKRGAFMLNTLLPYQIAVTADLVHRRDIPRDTAMATQPESHQSHYHLSLWYQLIASRTSQNSL